MRGPASTTTSNLKPTLGTLRDGEDSLLLWSPMGIVPVEGLIREDGSLGKMAREILATRGQGNTWVMLRQREIQ